MIYPRSGGVLRTTSHGAASHGELVYLCESVSSFSSLVLDEKKVENLMFWSCVVFLRKSLACKRKRKRGCKRVPKQTRAGLLAYLLHTRASLVGRIRARTVAHDRHQHS